MLFKGNLHYIILYIGLTLVQHSFTKGRVNHLYACLLYLEVKISTWKVGSKVALLIVLIFEI